MSVVQLPPQIVSLVHHVELNKAGWWEKAIQRLILGVVWLQGKPLTIESISNELSADPFHIQLDRSRLHNQLKALCDSGAIVCMPDQSFKITESELKSLENGLSSAKSIESRARERFASILSRHCQSLLPDKTWATFHERFLIPLFRDNGARVFETVSGQSVDGKGLSSGLVEFLDVFEKQIRSSLRSAMVEFLDPKDKTIKEYLLRFLKAYFFIEAGNLRDDTLKSLTRLANRKPEFTIFVDTNFLFSILGMHENPSNEAAILLSELIANLKGKVTVQLCVLPPTLEEAKRVLIAAQRELRDIRLTSNMAEAALQVGISGIRRRYMQDAQGQKSPISADNYFTPYTRNLLTVVREKGVELYNQSLDAYSTEQSVLDDISSQLQFEKTRSKQNPKSYEKLRHDMVIWHFAKSKRPVIDESPLETNWWIVTVDYRFLGFDSFKRRGTGSQSPICLHPTTLIQMLQLFVPRTSEFENAILSSLLMPFLFGEFDPEAERIAIRILEAMGRFENVEDISTETAASILLDEALRQRISGERDTQKQIELVREALIEEHRKKEEQIKLLKSESLVLKVQVSRKDAQLQTMSIQHAEMDSQLSEVKKSLDREENARRAAEGRISTLESSRELELQVKAIRRLRRDFGITWFLSFSVPAAIWMVLQSKIDFGRIAKPVWTLHLLALTVIALIWVILVCWRGQKFEHIRTWNILMLLIRFRKWIIGILASGIATGVLQKVIDLALPNGR